MDARAAVILLLSTPHVTNYDVLERNVVLNEDGGVVREQYICWDWDHDAGVHRAQWWCHVAGTSLIRRRDCWRLRAGGVVIECRQYRETVTWTDPELDDRHVWQVERRRVPRR